MKWFKPRVLIPVIIIVSLFLLKVEVRANSSNKSFAVTIPQTSIAAAASLGLNPQVAWDYGSFHWLQLDENDFTRLTASGLPFTYQADAGTIQVTAFRFDPLQDGEPPVPRNLQMNHPEEGFRLIQLIGPVNNTRLATIAATGVQILQYYPHHTYLVWASAQQAQSAAALNFVRWQGDFHPAYKISPDLADRRGLVQNVDIFFYNDGDIDRTLAGIAALGGRLLQYFPAQPDKTFYSAIVELDSTAFEDLSRMNTVLWFGFSSPEPILDDEMASQIVAGNHPGGVPITGYFDHLDSLGVSGAGVTWAIIDTGVDYDHPDLGPHIVGGYSFPGACDPPGQPGSDCLGGGHGTHVAGIVGGDASAGFADASGFLYGLGIAPEYGIYAMNSLMGTTWPPLGGWQEHSKRAVLGGAIGGNNSWTTGEGTAHGYQASERTHDFMVHDGNFDTTEIEPFIQVFSAGNSGPAPLTLTAPKEAKNLIIVASSLNYRVGSIDLLSSFSSRGPAVDGRLGVTVTAPGQQISSARNDLGGSCSTSIPGTNNLYAFCSGTSMAAPHVSGAIVLATEWWRGFNAGADPSPAMAKALLVNSAVDMGTADIPNIHEGWGRINITNLINPDTNVLYFDQTHIFTDTGQQWELIAGVPDPDKPLKITLAWADAPGAVGANPALVNNLNLTVITGGSTYRGNVFSNGWSIPGGEYDNLNNLENVFIQNPGDSITIIIDAVNIAGDGVMGNEDLTDQNFALICSNCLEVPNFTLAADPTELAVCAPQDALFDIEVGSILGFSEPVSLDVSGHPPGTTTSFSVNPVIPPGLSQLTIVDTHLAEVGSYPIEISGTAVSSIRTLPVTLNVFASIPSNSALLAPENFSTDIPLQPEFSWSHVEQAYTYTLEISKDSSFDPIVYSAEGLQTTSHIPAITLEAYSIYYWRVQAHNACGAGLPSPTFVFITAPAAGSCPAGSQPTLLFSEDFETGAPGWTSGGTGNTWSLSSNRSQSGSYSYYAINSSTVSDQRLVSPPISLPAGQSPISLSFWNYQHMESRSAGGCWDGAILEVSPDGGSTWDYVQNSHLLTDPYDGTIQSGYSNPLAGIEGWCGDPQDWLNSIVDIDAYAGETVQFRFRLGTDSLIGREGWYIDDVAVHGCQPGYLSILLDSQTQETLPGSVLVYEFQLWNIGQEDEFNLSLSGNAWETTLLTSSPVNAPIGSLITIQVQVEAPDFNADNLDTSDTFTLMAASSGDPDLILQVTGTTSLLVTPGVSVSAENENQAGAPGEELEYAILVTNTGNFGDRFDLTIESAWPASLSHTSTGILAPGETTTLLLTVTIPPDASSDQSDLATLTAVSYHDSQVAAHVELFTEILIAPGISLTAETDSQPGKPGEEVVYTIILTNTGNIPDTFDLSVESLWLATLSLTYSGILQPAESASLLLTVTIPPGTSSGKSDQATLSAFSNFESQVSAQIQLITIAGDWRVFMPLLQN